MSGRNRGPPNSMKPGAHPPPPHHMSHDPSYGRGPLGPPIPHPASILDDMRRGPHLPPHAHAHPHPPPPPMAIIEERLSLQHQEIQSLLVDNQRLAATHVALKQELAAAQHELHSMSRAASALQADADAHLREFHDKSMRMEAELREADAVRIELMQVRADLQKLAAARQELAAQAQALSQDLARATNDLQQLPALKAEIDATKQQLQNARAAVEYEKKANAETYEQRQAMEKNLITMAREVEKLRAEIANAEKRARAAAAAGNSGAGYGGNFANPDTGYVANPYPPGYGVNPIQGGADGVSQYGPGPGPASWGVYDMQRAHGRR